MKLWHSRIGLRTLKTALAVFLSVLLIRQFAAEELSVFYAAFGALIAMDTTFSRSLMQGVTQLVGVLGGTVFGYLSVLLFPSATPAWVAGIGVLLLIVLCNAGKLSFTASLSCIIFLSACLTTTDNILRDSMLRLRDTSVGIGIALTVNILIRPYNNKKRILSLLQSFRQQIPLALAQIVVREQFPDLRGYVELLRGIDRELTLYHSQRFFHRTHDDEALLRGCYRLAERIMQELEAICGMDSLGDLTPENAERLQSLGLSETVSCGRKCTPQDGTVMNYHLEKLLDAYQYLGELMLLA